MLLLKNRLKENLSCSFLV